MKRKQPGVKKGKTGSLSAVAADNGLNRRTFVGLIPALGAAAASYPHLQVRNRLRRPRWLHPHPRRRLLPCV